MLTFEGIAGIIHFVERHGPQETEKTEYAGVAELADAQASGACGRKIVWVQVPSPASFFVIFCMVSGKKIIVVSRRGGMGGRAGFRGLWSFSVRSPENICSCWHGSCLPGISHKKRQRKGCQRSFLCLFYFFCFPFLFSVCSRTVHRMCYPDVLFFSPARQQ